jgi:hypothetical protein
MSQQEMTFERGIAVGAGVAVGVACVGLAGQLVEWARQNLRMPPPEAWFRLRLDLCRHTDPELFYSLVIEEVERLDSLTYAGMFSRSGGGSFLAVVFYFSLNLTSEESLRIDAKRLQKSQARRAARRTVLAGIIQPHREETLLLNPKPRRNATQSIFVAAAQRAKEAVLVERPVAQPKKRRGDRTGKQRKLTNTRLELVDKFTLEGCIRSEAITKTARITKKTSVATLDNEKTAIRLALRKRANAARKENFSK